jgi:hypothetical protein
MLRRTSRSAHRLAFAGAVAALGIVGIPLVASASPQARSAAAAGAVYGGVTPQGGPVVIELSSNRLRVVQAAIGIRLTCTSGGGLTLNDSYKKLSVSRKGRFSDSFGPSTQRDDDGTTTDFEGSVSGALNAARTKLTGKWHLKLTEHDAAGAVTDTCDSGNVSWKAKQ